MKRDPECSIEECENPVLARNWCSTHYQRWRHHGDPEYTVLGHLNDELCSACQVSQKPDNHSWCLDCRRENAKIRNASEKGPRYRRYKLTRTDVENKKASQDNSCVICHDSFDLVEDHVDHDNRCCGKELTRNGGTCGQCVRDLLCGSCNQGLGNFKDSPERLANAIKYLAKWGVV